MSDLHKSWKGSTALKNNVLTQLESQYEKAALEPLQMDAATVEIHGWPNAIDYAFCAKMLGLEEGVLRLGFYLWEGFPEDKKGIRTFLKLRMEFLESIPVGVDLNAVCNEFIVWRLETADFHLSDSPIDQSVRALLLQTTEAFYQDLPEVHKAQAQIQRMLQEVEQASVRLWQKEKKVDLLASRTLNALQNAAAACTAFLHTATIADTASVYLYGANGFNYGRNVEAETNNMCDKLLQLLQAAPVIP